MVVQLQKLRKISTQPCQVELRSSLSFAKLETFEDVLDTLSFASPRYFLWHSSCGSFYFCLIEW